MAMNVCLVGHGMTGTWHARALARSSCVLHTLVGRRPEPTSEFAQRHGFERWTTSLDEALEGDTIDIVILANPSEDHAETTLKALRCGKHVLVEIPIAMSVSDAEEVVSEATVRGRKLGVVHPLRARPELIALRRRLDLGSEHTRLIDGRFFIHRLLNVGATGYQRSWTDNLLWHQMAHIVDAATWLSGGSTFETHGIMAPTDPITGTPMDVAIMIATDAALPILCVGSYHGRERIFDLLVVTDLDSYRLDVFADTLTTGSGPGPAASEEETCALVTLDFIDAVTEDRDPMITGDAVLPAMRVLGCVQKDWDERHGSQPLPGRPIGGNRVEGSHSARSRS